MTGRKIFEKYNFVFDFFVHIIKLFPPKIRYWRLNSICMKNGKIAILRRYVLIKSLAKKCGKNVAVFANVYIENIDKLTIGDNVSIHQMCYIDAEGEIEIGNDVSIAHRCTILSSNHKYNSDEMPIKYQGMILEKTVLKNNIWVGCGTTILAGVTVNDGAVIGSNSTVTKDVLSNSVVVGSPAKMIKKRGC